MTFRETTNDRLTTRFAALCVFVFVLWDTAHGLLFLAHGQPALERDSLGYWRLGGQIARGDWLMAQDAVAFRPPLYPAFLAAWESLFGDDALIAAAVAQQVSCTLVSLMTAWACWRLTGSKVAFLGGLLLSAACVTRHAVANTMLSDNLLLLAVIVYTTMLILWLRHPSLLSAALVGTTIAMAMLVKPIAQLLWVPTLVVMTYHLIATHQRQRLSGNIAITLAAVGLLVAPWFLRNQICFGEPFLARFSGRSLWWSCFYASPDRHPLLAGLRLVDGPQTRRLLAEIEGTEAQLQQTWSVYGTLRDRGFSELDAEELMLSVSREAIQTQPVQFALARLGNLMVFWFQDGPRQEWSPEMQSALDPESSIGPSYAGQHIWSWPPLAELHDHLINFVWRPHRILYAMAALVVFAAGVVALLDSRTRTVAIALWFVLAYFSVVCATFGRPNIRYRMIIEPQMIILFMVGVVALRRLPWWRDR